MNAISGQKLTFAKVKVLEDRYLEGTIGCELERSGEVGIAL
jgi:hypothetical protein